jgi:hypothetical protein
MRARTWLRLLVVGALIAVPMSLPGSALANSAFDQYVEQPPDSGSQSSGNNVQNTGKNPQKPGSTATGKTTSGQASEADPMVAWATGETPAQPAGTAADPGGSSASPKSSGSSGGGDSTASGISTNGSLEALSSDDRQAPILLIVLMAGSAILLAGFTLLRKRQIN